MNRIPGLKPFFGAFVLSLVALTVSQAFAFSIQGRKVIDANGTEFLMRGVNHPHNWFAGQLSTAIPAITATKANCVRVVLSNGRRWTKNSASDVQNVINLCKQNKLIAILEVHDCTGYSEQSGSVQLSTAVDYWIELKNTLVGQEKWVIINIANEPFGNNVTADDWVNGHKTAIGRLRTAGFTHLLMVDAANWGQDWSNTTRSRAKEVFDADTRKNTIFSIHMYDVYSDDAKVNTYLQAFVTANLPLCVGEFAADHGAGKPVAAQAILTRCKEHGMGYIGWSWKGNSSGLESLDIAQNWNGSPLTTWGNLLINGTNGIKATAATASVFSGTAVAPIPEPKVEGRSYTRLRAGGGDRRLFDLRGSLLHRESATRTPGAYIIMPHSKKPGTRLIGVPE
ncbi:MAG: glycoside hydrolase family 5 protein [Chitinispirillaceae bacterium]|nr:glycoside hydrolase family 5 protein [Chitinispirillaceae bacterium]